jgi:hypothetical protein
MKITKTGLVFSDFSMIFGEICKIFVFYIKRKKKRKEKGLLGI